MFNRASRVLLVAPHPDDESLACGLMLQSAVRAGATMSILYLTDGDNNAWPQRLFERKWRLNSSDRRRWGQLRRAETLRALAVLGVDPSCARFAELPDQGLTNLLMSDANTFRDLIERAIVDLAPTHLFAPSLWDIHPDHNATAVAVRLALGNLRGRIAEPELWTFAVHGDHPAFAARAVALAVPPDHAMKKLRAIEQHRSQLKLSGKRFRGYAMRTECFCDRATETAFAKDGALRLIATTSQHFVLQLMQRPRGRWRVLLLAHDRARNPFGLVVRRSLGVDVDLAPVSFEKHGATVRLTILREGLSPGDAVYVKLDYRPIFFDRGGWLEIVPATVAQADALANEPPSREAVAAA